MRLTKRARGILLVAFLAAVSLIASPALAQQDYESAQIGGVHASKDVASPLSFAPLTGRSGHGLAFAAKRSATYSLGLQDTEQSDGFDVAITGGLDGIHKPGRSVPVNIVVRAEKLLTGELVVESSVGDLVLRHRLEIEVPGGSTKRFIVTVPTAAFGTPRVTVRIRPDDQPTFVRRVDLRADSNLEFVGVMPLVANPDNIPRSSPLAVDAGAARLIPISPELLGTGFEGLLFLDSIVATAADLDALSGREAEAITAWVAAGGHLLVDELDGPVPRIPAAWQPQNDQATAAEFGLVRLTKGAAKAGVWGSFLLPTPVDGESDGLFFQRETRRLRSDLSRDAGFSLPPISGVLLLIVVYAVVVGPISYVFLRRRQKQTLLWAVIPALALLATGAVYLVGAELRGGTARAHATMIVNSEGGSYAVSHVLIDKSAGGIEVPHGWSPTMQTGHNAFDSSSRVHIRPVAAGFTSSFELASGEFAIASARGPTNTPGLELLASSDQNGMVSGTVKNASTARIHDLIVVAGDRGINLGMLAANQTASFALNGIDSSRIWNREELWWELLDSRLWETGRPNLGIFNVSVDDRGGFNDHPPGTVLALGWTEDLEAPVQTLGGDSISAGTTLFATQKAIAPTGARFSDMTTRQQLLRGGQDTEIRAPAEFEEFDDFAGFSRATYQLLIPDSSGEEPLIARVPDHVLEMTIWDENTWSAVPLGAGESREFHINPSMLTNGLLHVRVFLNPQIVQLWNFNGQVLSLSQLPTVDVVAPELPPDHESPSPTDLAPGPGPEPPLVPQ